MNAYIIAVAPLSMALSQLVLGVAKVIKRTVSSEPTPHWTEYLRDCHKDG